MNTRPFSQTGQMIELCCQYLSVQCIWLYLLIMSRTRFRVLSICLWTGCLRVRVQLRSLKLPISHLFQTRSSLRFGFTLKCIPDMIRRCSHYFWRLPVSSISLSRNRFVIIVFTVPKIINCKNKSIAVVSEMHFVKWCTTRKFDFSCGTEMYHFKELP